MTEIYINHNGQYKRVMRKVDALEVFGIQTTSRIYNKIESVGALGRQQLYLVDDLEKPRRYKSITPETVEKVKALYETGLTYKEVGEMLGIHESTAFRIGNGDYDDHVQQEASL